MSRIVSVCDLKKRIGGKRVLDGLSFEMEEGRVVGLLGPNGAGKSTLLQILMNLRHQDAGYTWLMGRPAGVETQRFVSYLPDASHLFGWMRVSDAISYYSDMFPDFDPQRSHELCEFLELNVDDKIKSLSKGFVERVLIMLTFSRNAKLYLLDEPAGGIDPLSRDKIIKTIFRASGQSSILLSTQQIGDFETLLDDVLFMHEGRLIFADSAENIREGRGMSIEECYREVFSHA